MNNNITNSVKQNIGPVFLEVGSFLKLASVCLGLKY